MSDTVFETIFLVGFLVGSVVRAAYTLGHRREPVGIDGRTALDALLTALAGIGLVVLPLVAVLTRWLDFAAYPRPAWLGWLGAVLFAGAIVLLWRSHADLGRHWSARVQVRRDHALVTTGVYRYVRHPMYTAHLLWGLAQALLLANWLAGPALLVFMVPLLLIRIPREERLLLDHFGDAYQQYVARTGRLVPGGK